MAIQQHPVPQDISNYRFRLIGDMTIKQFASLGISIILSVMVYSAPLPFFFKYPLSFIFLILGVGMAFVPIQGRTLDVWIIAFIKSIYSPTQYIWKHGQKELVETLAPNVAQQGEVGPITPVVPVSTPTADSSAGAAKEEKDTPPTDVLVPDTTNSEQTPPTIDDLQSTTLTPPLPAPEPTPAPVPTTKNADSLPTPADQSSSLPIPITPSTPNTLVGLTLNSEGKILDGVLVEIKNQNLTLRATKSNKLGQFLFARPLENGFYQLLAEKEDYKFDVYSIELNGEIMNPLKIQSLK